jgi:hypothetical protein
VQKIQRESQSGAFTVWLTGQTEGEQQFDRVVSLAGFRPNQALCQDLNVQWCDETEAPSAMAAWLRSQASPDLVARAAPRVDALLTGEPNFYVLGSKSYGRDASFLFADGLAQIQQLFTLIADREGLDLYDSIKDPFR